MENKIAYLKAKIKEVSEKNGGYITDRNIFRILDSLNLEGDPYIHALNEFLAFLKEENIRYYNESEIDFIKIKNK